MKVPASSNRPSRAKVASVDNIVAKGTLPMVSPLAVRRACREFQESLPAQEGREDRIDLRIKAGDDARVCLLRNGLPEFQAEGTQGAHDVDHVYFESAWEQLGGQPIAAASPLNEVLVNGFEWALTPQWRQGRVEEMSLQGLAPSDDNFLEFQKEAGRDGARQLLCQTVAQNPWAEGLFRVAGRSPESFPSASELDMSLRLLALDSRPLDQVLGLIEDFSSCATRLARVVEAQAPEFVEQVNRQRTKAHQATEGESLYSSVSLPRREKWQNEATPIVEQMNGLLAQIPELYVHGLSTQGALS